MRDSTPLMALPGAVFTGRSVASGLRKVPRKTVSRDGGELYTTFISIDSKNIFISTTERCTVRNSYNNSVSRRTLLGGIAGAGAVPGILSAGVGAKDDSGTVVGDFEDGPEGWRTNGGNTVRSIEPTEPPTGVTHGEKVLEVTVNGDGFPSIETESIDDLDLIGQPYLLADVTPQLDQSVEQTLTFQIRIHHSQAGGTGKKGKNKSNGGQTRNEKSENVVESKEIVVAPGFTERLTWDLSDIDESIRRNPSRLQIQWYPTIHPPEAGSRGKQKQVDYSGTVHLDGVRTIGAVTELERERYRRYWQSLVAQYGPYRETTVSEQAEEFEKGQFGFDDGTTVDYTLEVLANDQFELTVDAETFKLGQGWDDQ